MFMDSMGRNLNGTNLEMASLCPTIPGDFTKKTQMVESDSNRRDQKHLEASSITSSTCSGMNQRLSIRASSGGLFIWLPHILKEVSFLIFLISGPQNKKKKKGRICMLNSYLASESMQDHFYFNQVTKASPDAREEEETLPLGVRSVKEFGAIFRATTGITSWEFVFCLCLPAKYGPTVRKKISGLQMQVSEVGHCWCV